MSTFVYKERAVASIRALTVQINRMSCLPRDQMDAQDLEELAAYGLLFSAVLYGLNLIAACEDDSVLESGIQPFFDDLLLHAAKTILETKFTLDAITIT